MNKDEYIKKSENIAEIICKDDKLKDEFLKYILEVDYNGFILCVTCYTQEEVQVFMLKHLINFAEKYNLFTKKENKEEKNKENKSTKDKIADALSGLAYKNFKDFCSHWNIDSKNFLLSSRAHGGAFYKALFHIARELDKQYKDHIKKSKELFTFNMEDGSIVRVNKDKIYCFSVYPLFRCVEDAYAAKAILKPLHRKLWGK